MSVSGTRNLDFSGGSTCGITLAEEAWCWGHAAAPGILPTRFGPDRNFSSVYPWFNGIVRDMGTCALTSKGEAYCITTTGSTRVGGSMTFSSFGTEKRHSCGVSSGDVYCWGSNSLGALGIGTIDTNPHLLPEKIAGGQSFVSVQVGFDHTCGLTTGKQLYCWGIGFSGAPPVPGCTACIGTPQAVAGGRTYESFSVLLADGAGSYGLCAVTAAGEVDCWGTFNSPPKTVQSPVPFKQAGAQGYYWGCALSIGGDVYCWKDDVVAKKLGGP